MPTSQLKQLILSLTIITYSCLLNTSGSSCPVLYKCDIDLLQLHSVQFRQSDVQFACIHQLSKAYQWRGSNSECKRTGQTFHRPAMFVYFYFFMQFWCHLSCWCFSFVPFIYLCFLCFSPYYRTNIMISDHYCFCPDYEINIKYQTLFECFLLPNKKV